MLALAPVEHLRADSADFRSPISKFEEVIREAGIRCRHLVCDLRHDRLLIFGTVGTFHDKQLVQESVRHLPGVEQICNHLHVTQT